MPDIKYEVVVEYMTTGKLLSPAASGELAQLGASIERTRRGSGELRDSLGGVASKTSDVTRAFASMGGAAADAFTGAVEKASTLAMHLGALGGAAAIGAVTYGVFGLNNQLEKTSIALADILTSGGVTSNLTEGMKMSAGLMKQIRADAAALPGETSDLAAIFKLAAIPGIAAGKDTSRIEKLSANAMAFGIGTAGLDGGTTARELSMLLGGRAGAHNTLGLQLDGLMGSKATSFNQMSGSKRFDYIEKALQKHEGSIALDAASFEGLWSTVKDNAKLTLSNATLPLFNHMKETMGEATTWFANNQDKVGTFTTFLGDRLAAAWDTGAHVFLTWEPAIVRFATGAYTEIQSIWTKIEPVVVRVGNAVRTSLGDGTALRHIESILKLYGEMKVAGGVTSALGPMRGLMGAMMGGGGGAASGAGAALGVGGGIAAAGLTALAATVIKGEMVGLATGNKDAIDAASRLSTSFGKLTDDIEGGQTGLSKFIQMVGADGTTALAVFFEGLHGILDFGDTKKQFNDVEDDIRERSWKDMLANPNSTAAQRSEAGTSLAYLQFKRGIGNDTLATERDDSPLDFSRGGAGAQAGLDKMAAAVAKQDHTTHFHGPIEITVSGNHDPSRVARDVFAQLQEMRRHPTSSRQTRNWSSTSGG